MTHVPVLNKGFADCVVLALFLDEVPVFFDAIS